MISRIVLDPKIQALAQDAGFLAKARDRFLNGDGYSRRFVYQHGVYKFVQRGDGVWVLYRESNGGTR